MTAFMETARRWWWGRTGRERQMLTVMGALLLIVGVWLLVVRPAWAWKSEAAGRRDQARMALIQVERGVARLAPGARATGGAVPVDLEPVIVASATAAGVTISTGMDEGGGLGFRAENVSSAGLFGWLAGLKASHGLGVTRLAVVENADATLSAEGAFARE